jgi:hypothetical protein
MLDLEQRLRDDVTREARAFDPSADLPARVDRRIRQRTRRNRIVAAAAVAVVGVAIGAGSLLATGGEETGRTETVDQPVETTVPETDTTVPPDETTGPDPETGGPEPTTATTAEPPVDTTVPGGEEETPAPTPAIGSGTPLSRAGIGPIVAGMTIREAEAAAGVDLAVDPAAWEAFGRTCGVFSIAGTDHLFVARTPAPTDDADAAVIDVVGGRLGTARTEDRIGPGNTVDEVIATYGQPTGTAEMWDRPTGQILLFESSGYRYGFAVDQGVVLEVRSGHVTDYADYEPCA